MADCIFCKIAQGDIPSAKIYEDDQVLAFLDINPIVPGHCLVIPKRHAETILDAPPEILAACCAAVKKVAKAVFDATGAEGMNILQNNFPVAGQEIDHIHFHLIPRFSTDGWKVPWPAKPYPPGEMDQMLDKIKGCL